jgi:N-acyl-L-homoserine lactone synthetase
MQTLAPAETLMRPTIPEPAIPYFTFHRVPANGDPDDLKRIYQLRYEVYCLECGFLPSEQHVSGLESDHYDPHVVHFMAQNEQGEIVGTLRLVQPAPHQAFPYEEHCKALHEGIILPPRAECGEVSRLVVRKRYRRRQGDSSYGVPESYVDPAADHDRRHLERPRDGSASRAGSDAAADGAPRRSNSPQILLGLYRAVYRHSRESGIRYWYAAMEPSLARALARFAFVFTPIGPECDYFGPVKPYIADLRELERLVGLGDPDLLAWLQASEH